MIELTAYIDGACRPNPGGTAAYGYVVIADETGVARHSSNLGSGPEMSNNVAEYAALHAVLSWFLDMPPDSAKLTICSDSEMLVEQMNDRRKCKGGLYELWYKACKLIVDSVRDTIGRDNLVITHIPEGLNTEAHNLCHKALDAPPQPKATPEARFPVETVSHDERLFPLSESYRELYGRRE